MTDIINTVLKSGQFPRLWQRAEITPLITDIVHNLDHDKNLSAQVLLLDFS